MINQFKSIEELAKIHYLIRQFIKNAPQFDGDNELAKLIGEHMAELNNLLHDSK